MSRRRSSKETKYGRKRAKYDKNAQHTFRVSALFGASCLATLMWMARGHRALFYSTDLLGQRGLEMDDSPVLRSRKSTDIAVEPTRTAIMTTTGTALNSVVESKGATATAKETPQKKEEDPTTTSTTASTTTSSSSNNDNSGNTKKKVIQETLVDLGISGFNADIIWESLIQEGEAILKRSQEQQEKESKKSTNTAVADSKTGNNISTQRLIAMEVGVHRARQCLQAARAGFQAVCVEPSPKSFPICKDAVNKQPPEIQERVHLHQKVASSKTGDLLEFSGSGSTGDHVGSVDVWNMKVQEPAQNAATAPKDPNMVQVPSVRLDDLLKNDMKLGSDERVFLAKIDTQGHEPEVFQGLTELVFQKQKIDYILLEYWPKGMDIMNTGDTSRMTCVAAKLLEDLHAANYTLYALPNLAHPKCPNPAKQAMRSERAPFHNFRDNCLYYYQLEKRFATDEYKMGYWSDMLAVAPGTPLLEKPLTTVGQALQRDQEARIASNALKLLQKK